MKFLSCEPLIGPLPKLDLQGIDWVIVGGESGRKPRPMKEEWVLDIQRQCDEKEIDFFFKQWGGTNQGGSKYLERMASVSIIWPDEARRQEDTGTKYPT